MLYADHTVLMFETRDDLQHHLNCFQRYCEEWKLHVNIDKTKIMIFGKGSNLQICYFLYNNNEIEFKYLGILFSKDGLF
jgi:hypothetical protein